MSDRLITISIRKYLVKQPRTKRHMKAAAYIRGRIAHYTKLREEDVKLSQELNELIIKQYSRTMLPVKCTVKMGADTAEVMPFGVERRIPTVVSEGGAKGDKKDKTKETKTVKPAEERKQTAPSNPQQSKQKQNTNPDPALLAAPKNASKNANVDSVSSTSNQ